jgi:hypothetical protein
MGLSIEKGHIAGLQIFVLNMSLVMTLGLFAGFALRSFFLLVLDRGRPGLVQTVRALAGAAFLVLGFLDFIFARNMLVWDRPPRAILAALVIAFPFVTIARKGKGSIKPPSARHAVFVGVTLFALCFVSVLTLLRAGMVPLTGDRVTLTVEMTGQEVGGDRGAANGTDRGRTTMRHVVVWLPYGDRLADIWLPSQRLRAKGRVYRLSKGLNQLGIPNLYQFVSVEGGSVGPNGAEQTVEGDLPFVTDGPLGVHPWWRPIQMWLLSRWETATSDDSVLALRTAPNASPFYPLVDGQGRAIRETYLLVLPPSGNATSRGSSPLEKNVQPAY